MAAITTGRLTLRDIMTPDPACAHPSDTVREVARVLTDDEISGVPVINERGAVVGVITRGDLLRRCIEGPQGPRRGTMLELMAEGMSRERSFDADDLGTVEEFMSTDLVTCFPDCSPARAARRMVERNVHRVIVVNEAMEPLGIVSALDLLTCLPDRKRQDSESLK